MLYMLSLIAMVLTQTGSDLVVGTPPPAAAPLWQQLLLLAFPMLLAGFLAWKPLNKLSDLLHAKAADANASLGIKAAATLGEHLSTSLEHLLENSADDLKTIVTDPAKRAEALKSLEDRAKAEIPGTVAAAIGAAGSTALSGKAVQALDAATAKAGLPVPS